MVGQTISHYKIAEKLGEGGMGVVYKAEDTKLERTVALKFLAPHLVSDEDVRKRFEREAKASAALNHANICHVYEIDEADGKTFIAMAFVEGQGLDEKIAAGPLKLNEALDIAHQIAEGLQEAHAHRIVHRDIKPANVMVTPKGGSKAQVTIMDFGLAQLTEHSKLTRKGETMGTVAYMSPEQTLGADVDHRTDIWALGCVLYEMISGRQPFKGHYEKAVMYSITSEEPEPLTALRTGVPMEIEWIVGKCLAKEAGSRYQNAGELAVDLRNLQEKLKSGRSTILRTSVGARPAVLGEADAEIGTRAEPVPLQPPWKRTLPWAVAAGAVLVAVAVSFVHFHETPPDSTAKPLRRFAFTPANFDGNENLAVISPNGEHIAYIAGASPTKLWIQDLDQARPREMEGTEGALRPFWSPGSDFIGYLANDQLKKISVQGGPAITLCALPGVSHQFFAGAWSPGGQSIVFASSAPLRLFEVPARGGSPKLFIDPKDMEQEISFSGPHFLPGGRGLLYTVGQLEAGQLILHDLESGKREALGVTASGSRYSPSGHILYTQSTIRPGFLWALPFSLSSLKVTGEAFPIAENARWPSLADDGTLVYREEGGPRQRQLVWRSRGGERLEEISRRWEMVTHPSLHPDGRRLAIEATDKGNRDIWVLDFVRSIWTRVTESAGLELRPVWSPSGDRIAFSSTGDITGAPFSIFLKPADGSGKAEPFVPHVTQEVASDWSQDGKHFVFYRLDPRNQRDLWRLEINADGRASEPIPLLATPFDEREPMLSPDGNWLAYVSNRSGRHEVYVRPFPEGGDQQVSSNGGMQPRWRRDGRELYYVQGEALMAVALTTKPSLSIGLSAQLFSDPGLPQLLPGVRQYDVATDGERFIIAAPYAEAGESPPAIRVVENWPEQFRGSKEE